jgi:diadenosine tetraphosphate (Ap4A) HIT family hydrolase
MSDAQADYETGPARSAYHRNLPIDDRLSAQPLTDSPFFGFEGEIAMKPLEPMLVPERPRSGEHDAAECFHCGPGTEHAFWKDDLWHVGAPPTFGLPFVAGLAPNAHVRLDQMDADLVASFGEIVQRLAGAIQALDGVARTHFSRWGDGSAHFHMHFMARPLGMMQGRGPMLAFWDDVLPPTDPGLIAENRRAVARALAAVSGAPLV